MKHLLRLLLAVALAAVWVPSGAQQSPIQGVIAPSTSAQFRSVVTDETGTGPMVFGTNPMLSWTQAASSIASGAVTFDMSTARFFGVSATAHVNTVSITNVPAGVSGFNVQITGNGTPSDWVWPSSVVWKGGQAPNIPIVPGRIIVLAFDTADGGTSFVGDVKYRGDGRAATTIESFKYFVNPTTGNDANPCTSFAAPCASFGSASAGTGLFGKVTPAPGDRICLVNGTQLRETVAPKASGTVNAPIVIEGCGPGDQAIISNSSLLQSGSWSNVAGTVYSVSTALVAPAPGGSLPCFTWINSAGVHKGMCKGVRNTNATATITIASPGVVTWSGHGMTWGNAVRFSTSGALPTGITAGTTYYVVNPTSTTFQLSATQNGTAINTSGSQSGTHTATSELGTYQYAFSGGSLFVNTGAAVTSADKFEIGQGTTYGVVLNGVSHWRLANLRGLYNGSYGVMLNQGSATVTITIAAPGVFTASNHGLIAGQVVSLSTSGTLPTGLTAGPLYYVVNPTTNTFQVATSPGGTAITTTGSQSGTHTAYYAADDIVLDGVELAYNSGDNINCVNGQCTNVVLRGVNSHHAWPDGSGAGDCLSWHGAANGAASSFVFEYGRAAWCGKDGINLFSGTTATVRGTFFDNANAGYLHSLGGDAHGVGNNANSASGSLTAYNNIIAGDGSPYAASQARYQFRISNSGSPFTNDNFLVRGFCNTLYAATVTHSTFRGVELRAGANTSSIWKNNITKGPQGIGVLWASGGVPIGGIDYNTVNTSGNYSGLSQPANDLTTDPTLNSNFTLPTTSPAYNSGVVITGLTRPSSVSRGAFGCGPLGAVGFQ